MSDNHDLTIKVIRYDLYVYNMEKAKKTKRGSFDVFYSPNHPGFYMFETWGYKVGKGFGQVAQSIPVMAGKIRDRLQKKNLNVHQRKEWGMRLSFPKTKSESADRISRFEFMRALQEEYTKEVSSETSIRAGHNWLSQSPASMTAPILNSPEWNRAEIEAEDSIHRMFTEWLEDGLVEFSPNFLRDDTPVITEPVVDTKEINEQWGAW